MRRLIIFIKTLSGYRFGGFTSNQIPTNAYSAYSNKYNDGFLPDKTAFVFSIDKKQKYNIKDEKYATRYYYDSNNGGQRFFEFGYTCIKICDNCTMNSDNCVNGSTFDNCNNEINGKDNNFIVDSFEVYQIDYKNE